MKFEAVRLRQPDQLTHLDEEEWRAVVDGVLQRPTFNCAGAASAFGLAVSSGRRRAEPVDQNND